MENNDQTLGSSPSSNRRELLLEEAGELFLRNGFDKVTVDEIIARSGGSKTGIYREFGGKEGLFSESIRQRCKKTLQPIAQPLPDSEDLISTLLNFSVKFLKCVLSDDGIRCHRIAVAETRRFPEVGQAFYAAGPQSVYQALSEIFLRMERQSFIPDGSGGTLARQYHGMILTELQLGRLLIDSPMPNDTTLRCHVQRAIALLLYKPSSEG